MPPPGLDVRSRGRRSSPLSAAPGRQGRSESRGQGQMPPPRRTEPIFQQEGLEASNVLRKPRHGNHKEIAGFLNPQACPVPGARMRGPSLRQSLAPAVPPCDRRNTPALIPGTSGTNRSLGDPVPGVRSAPARRSADTACRDVRTPTGALADRPPAASPWLRCRCCFATACWP